MTPRARLPVGAHGNITVRKVPSGSWCASAYYRDSHGVRRLVRATAQTKGKARAALLERFTDYAPYSTGGRFTTTAEAWFTQWSIDKAPATVRKIRRVLDIHILPELGALQLREVRTSTCEALVRAVESGRVRSGKGGHGVAQQVRTALIAILDEGVRQDLIETNPALRTGVVRTRTPEVRTLTAEQLREVRQLVHDYASAPGVAAGAYLADVVDFMIGTGVRSGEAYGLRWEDVDLESGRVIIQGMLTHHAGAITYQATTKTGNARAFYLPAWVLETLRARRARVGVESEFVFLDREGRFLRSTTVIWALKRALGERYAWVSPRTFRKSVATLVARELGDELASVQLGHESARMTRQHYIERRGEADARSVLADLA